ncbi:MAG: 50S ribosomal protein L22 [Bacilli bacterium]|nr:50S ribosomal protein L22 [Bacillota bacterium]HOA77970.1 50S ribosomal protein L22 [Bacilli bacterium]HPZ26718.1 50S ribosomal protein L22 [Bacilli bacterium]HQC89187.1 50S ribosomal protein L22 [Bacilli bacterium]
MGGRLMEAKATARTVRVSPRKARLVIDLVRGKNVAEATAILRLIPNRPGVAIEKVLRSATANAVNNHDLDKNLLYIKEAYVNEGPILKTRLYYRNKGIGYRVSRRTSHITIVLGERQ